MVTERGAFVCRFLPVMRQPRQPVPPQGVELHRPTDSGRKLTGAVDSRGERIACPTTAARRASAPKRESKPP